MAAWISKRRFPFADRFLVTPYVAWPRRVSEREQQLMVGNCSGAKSGRVDSRVGAGVNPILTHRCDDDVWSMRSWESARPWKEMGRGSDFQDRMDRVGRIDIET